MTGGLRCSCLLYMHTIKLDPIYFCSQSGSDIGACSSLETVKIFSQRNLVQSVPWVTFCIASYSAQWEWPVYKSICGKNSTASKADFRAFELYSSSKFQSIFDNVVYFYFESCLLYIILIFDNCDCGQQIPVQAVWQFRPPMYMADHSSKWKMLVLVELLVLWRCLAGTCPSL